VWLRERKLRKIKAEKARLLLGKQKDSLEKLQRTTETHFYLEDFNKKGIGLLSLSHFIIRWHLC
jgi:hypothetical protein